MKSWKLLLLLFFCNTFLKAETLYPNSRHSSSSSSRYSIQHGSSSPVLLNLGTGMPILRGSAGFGFNLGGLFKILDSHPLYLGGDLGFSFWNFRYYYYSYTSSAVSVSAFHVLLSMKYIHALERNLRLTGGISIGPSFAATSLPYDSGVLFTFLLRPGIQFDIAKSFSLGVETNFGVVGSSFAFYPLLSAIFSI